MTSQERSAERGPELKRCPVCDAPTMLHENDWCIPSEWCVICTGAGCGIMLGSDTDRTNAISLANRRPAPPSDGWLPIETAPTQCTILLWALTDTETGNWKMATGFWLAGYRDEPGQWEWDGRRLKSYDVQPTHWQPLPSPPGAAPKPAPPAEAVEAARRYLAELDADSEGMSTDDLIKWSGEMLVRAEVVARALLGLVDSKP